MVLVTGATSGFGVAIARRFAHEGHRITAAGRRAERLAQLAAELGNAVALTLPLDVRDRAAIAGLPFELAEIDLLVNNAGLARGLEPAQRADLDGWEEMVDTNIKGLMTMTRAVPGHRGKNSNNICTAEGSCRDSAGSGAVATSCTGSRVSSGTTTSRTTRRQSACRPNGHMTPLDDASAVSRMRENRLGEAI
ncbi:MAG: SDR family NAD(P)-dependent oxidoreductase [Myxococcales bacterium]